MESDVLYIVGMAGRGGSSMLWGKEEDSTAPKRYSGWESENVERGNMSVNW